MYNNCKIFKEIFKEHTKSQQQKIQLKNMSNNNNKKVRIKERENISDERKKSSRKPSLNICLTGSQWNLGSLKIFFALCMNFFMAMYMCSWALFLLLTHFCLNVSFFCCFVPFATAHREKKGTHKNLFFFFSILFYYFLLLLKGLLFISECVDAWMNNLSMFNKRHHIFMHVLMDFQVRKKISRNLFYGFITLTNFLAIHPQCDGEILWLMKFCVKKEWNMINW